MLWWVFVQRHPQSSPLIELVNWSHLCQNWAKMVKSWVVCTRSHGHPLAGCKLYWKGETNNLSDFLKRNANGTKAKFWIQDCQTTSSRSNVHLLGNQSQTTPEASADIILNIILKFSLGFITRATLEKAEQEGLENASATSSTLRASTLGQVTF